jgi:hypothetical protein
MDKRKNFNDCTAIENDLKVLEQTLIQIKYTLIKKLGYLSSPTIENDNAHSLFEVQQTSSRYSRNIGSLLIGGGSSLSGGGGAKTSQVIYRQ